MSNTTKLTDVRCPTGSKSLLGRLVSDSHAPEGSMESLLVQLPRNAKRVRTIVYDSAGRKQCQKCLNFLEVTQFGANKSYADGKATRCNECRADDCRWSKYRVTKEQYNSMLQSQNYRCFICLSPDPGGRGSWVVDHDHRCCSGNRSCGKCITGKLLCTHCNVGLGHFKEDSEILMRAYEYASQKQTTAHTTSESAA